MSLKSSYAAIVTSLVTLVPSISAQCPISSRNRNYAGETSHQDDEKDKRGIVAAA